MSFNDQEDWIAQKFTAPYLGKFQTIEHHVLLKKFASETSVFMGLRP